VCTVVTRWSAEQPPQILALRDELTSREFDDPGRWWPDLPDVVGGRDRLAGGTWCASHIDTGTTALVLNRPERRIADAGSPSRGVLPLLAVQHELEWVSEIDVAGMASFALVLAMPGRVTSWIFDGTGLTREQHAPGTQMFTSGGAEDGKADRYLTTFEQLGYPDGWRATVELHPPMDDPAALVVRHEQDGRSYGTVFGQLINSRPGRLHLEYHRRPWAGERWTILDFG
jgi:hypothetical protein